MVKIKLKGMRKDRQYCRRNFNIVEFNGCVTISNDGILVTITDLELSSMLKSFFQTDDGKRKLVSIAERELANASGSQSLLNKSNALSETLEGSNPSSVNKSNNGKTLIEKSELANSRTSLSNACALSDSSPIDVRGDEIDDKK